jgi:hypothetical protein
LKVSQAVPGAGPNSGGSAYAGAAIAAAPPNVSAAEPADAAPSSDRLEKAIVIAHPRWCCAFALLAAG